MKDSIFFQDFPHMSIAPTSTDQISKPINPNANGAVATKSKKDDNQPSVAKLIKQVRKEANRNPQDWQKEYEEKKKAAMAAMNSKSVNVGSLSAFHKTGGK